MEALLKEYFEAEAGSEGQEQLRAKLAAHLATPEVASFLSVIQSLDSYFNSVEDSIRGSAVQLVANLLVCGDVQLDALKIHHLILFFLSRVEDYPSLQPSICGIKAIIAVYGDQIDEKYNDYYQVLHKIFEEVNVQSIAQSIRSDIFILVTTIFSTKSAIPSLKPFAAELVEGVLMITNGERDPRCLVKALCLHSLCLSVFPDAGDACGEKLFDAVAGYFPITFRPAVDDKFGITTEILVSSVENAFCSHSSVAKFAIPLMVEKLSSTDVNADGKLDAMHCLVRLSTGFKSESQSKKIDYLMVANVFSPSLSRLSEILLEIITSNAAGDEGEGSATPTAAKSSIVRGALDCISAICSMISNVRDMNTSEGTEMLQRNVEPILQACMHSMLPVTNNGVTSLQLNSLSGLSSVSILTAIAKSSYWFFSIVLVRCSSALLKDIDRSIKHGRQSAGTGTAASVAALSPSAFYFFEVLFTSLDSSVNYSDVILSGGKDVSRGDLSGGPTTSYFTQQIFISVLSRLQRSLCLFDARPVLMGAAWESLELCGDPIDSWMDSVPAVSEVSDSSGGGCCGGSGGGSSGGGCCKSGGEEEAVSCCAESHCDKEVDVNYLVLKDSSAPIHSFLTAAMKCLKALLIAAPVALFPAGAIECVTMVAVDITSKGIVCKPNVITGVDVTAPAGEVALELNLLHSASLSMLSSLFANIPDVGNALVAGCTPVISPAPATSEGRTRVVIKVVEHLFQMFLLCDKFFSSVLKVLLTLSETEQAINQKSSKNSVIYPLTKRLITALVHLVKSSSEDNQISSTGLRTVLQIVSGCGVDTSSTKVGAGIQDDLLGLSTNHYITHAESLSSSKDVSGNKSLYWLSPANRYRVVNAIVADQEASKSAGSVCAAALLKANQEVSSFMCDSSMGHSLLSDILSSALLHSADNAESVGIAYEINRITLNTLACDADTLLGEGIAVGILRNLVDAANVADSQSKYVPIMRLATASVSSLSVKSDIFKITETANGFSANPVFQLVDAALKIFDYPQSEGVTAVSYEVNAWYICTIISKLPHNSERLQDILFKAISAIHRTIAASMSASEVCPLKGYLHGSIALLMWISRALFMRSDIPIRVPQAPVMSISWQMLLLDNILAILLNGKLSDHCNVLLCVKPVQSRLPGGQPLHLSGAQATYFLKTDLAATPYAIDPASVDDSMDMDVADTAMVVESEQSAFLKYALALRMAVLSADTDSSGFILTSISKNAYYHNSFWKQKLFHRLFLPMSSCIINGKAPERSSDTSLVLWALCELLSGTPHSVLGSSDTKVAVLKVLVCALGAKSTASPQDAIVKAKSAALVTFEDILNHEQPPMSIISHLATIIPELLNILRVSSLEKCHAAVDRARACRCLLHILTLPYAELHPYKPVVLKGLRVSLDDPKKAVRKLAVKVRNEWSVASGVNS